MTDIHTQLTELSVTLTGKVAELLASAAKQKDPAVRDQIWHMIENNLPDVIMNTIMKTTVLHSPAGVDHLKHNLDAYAEDFAQRFIHNQM